MLTINKKPYPVKTGYSVIRIFCLRRGIEFHQFYDRFAKMQFEQMTIENMDDLAHLTLAFIDRGCESENQENDLKINDVIDWFGEDQTNINKITDLLVVNTGAAQKKTAKAEKK